MPWYWQIVQLCPLPPNAAVDKAMMCGGWGYTMQQQSPYTESTNQPGDQSFSLDVAYYLKKTLVFRVPTVQPQEVNIQFYFTPMGHSFTNRTDFEKKNSSVF